MKHIYNYIGTGLLALSFTSFISCTEIEHGVNDIDSWEEVKDYTEQLNHPCMLHTQEDFDFVKSKIAENAQPWANAYQHLTQSEYAQTYRLQASNPVKKLARLDANNWGTKNERWEEAGIADEWYEGIHNNYTNLMCDAAAAYQLALRWKLSDDKQFADAAVGILNGWVGKCEGYLLNKSNELLDPNQYLIAMQIYQLANAGEILRAYEGWSSADFTKFKNWMVDVFYSTASNFLIFHNNQVDCPLHYWLNWDLAQMTALLSIGILTDDSFKINEAIQYFKFGTGGGNIYNAVPFVYADPNPENQGALIGQCMESGRDQGHATLCVSLLAAFCQMAKNVGEDLFTFDNNRAWAMCEYVAKYNYGTVETGSNSNGWNLSTFKYNVSDLPYTNYENCTGNSWPTMSYEEHQAGNETRGTVRPTWELVRSLSKDYGLTSYYSDMWVSTMRENSERNFSDGGAGDYGPNSGGFDQLGYGTLMFAKD